jgi:hypothetical protein
MNMNHTFTYIEFNNLNININHACLNIAREIRLNIILKSIEEYNINRNNIKVEINEREINNTTRGVSIIFTDNNIRRELAFNSVPRGKTIYLSETQDVEWRHFIKIFHKKYVDMHKEFMNNYSMHMEDIELDYITELSHFNYNTQYTIKKFTKTMLIAEYYGKNKHFKHNQYIIRPNVYIRHSMNDDELINAINKTQEYLLNIQLENNALINKLNYRGLDTLNLNTINEIQECSVCYDECSTITNCNHYLCANCRKALRKKECPICRRPLHHARIVKEIQEQKAEPSVIEEEEEKEEEEPKYYNIEEQELFNRYILTQKNSNDNIYKEYYLNIDITDNELTRLFPNIMRNPRIKYTCSVDLGFIKVSVKTN